MGRARFTSYSPQFRRKHISMVDVLLGHMAQDTEVAIKTKSGTPVKTGAMKGAVVHRRVGINKFRVESPKEYSAVQEQGARRGARPFTKYTTPGTGKGWFRGAVDGVIRNGQQYINEAKRSVGL
jgi:hypothetical protein